MRSILNVARRHHLGIRGSHFSDYAGLMHQYERMNETAGFRTDQTHVMPDTYFMMWRASAAARAFADAWLTEVSERSMREQTNFGYALSQSAGPPVPRKRR